MVLATIVGILGYFVIQVNNTLNLFLADEVERQAANLSQTLPSSSSFVSESNVSGGQNSAYIFPVNFIQDAFIADPTTLISIIFRTVVISSLIFIIMKWLGAKGISQLSPFAFLIFIGLGSAIGDPMIYRELAIPQAIVAVIMVVVFFKIIDYFTSKSKRFKKYFESRPLLIIEYGNINQEALKRAKLDVEDLQAQMRIKGIEKVSEIRFAYLESNGQMSFIHGKNS